MNYCLNADEVNMEMAKGIRNYTQTFHSKFSTKHRRTEHKRIFYICTTRYAVAQLVEALRYKRWCHWNFSLT